ncbi:MAG: hypothetical protein CMJ94_07230 [Planctomycetes bacterium]|nr:hypothetical protein [Planctomycetota bacterium]
MRALSALLVALASLASAAAAQQSAPGSQDAAYLVERYEIFRVQNHTIEQTTLDGASFLVVLQHWVTVEDARTGAAFTILDLADGTSVPLRIVDIGGLSVPTDGSEMAVGWFLLEPAGGATVDPQGGYQLIVHYDQVASWDETEDGSAARASANTEQRKSVEKLDPTRIVSATGALQDRPDSAPLYGGSSEGFFDRLKLDLTPQIAESSRELGLSYQLSYPLTQLLLVGSTPGRVEFDFAVDGRWGSDRSDPTLTDFLHADLSARAMLLPQIGDRYNPVGLRLAAGYEDGDRATDGGATMQAQLVVSVPYVGDALLWWHEAIGLQRPFAPPYLAAGFVESDAEVAGMDQSRFVFEAGWKAPLATEWDLNLRWQSYSFDEDALDDDELFTADLTYYPDGNLDQGLRMSFEEGYRAAVGDVGSTVFLGYLIRL